MEDEEGIWNFADLQLGDRGIMIMGGSLEILQAMIGAELNSDGSLVTISEQIAEFMMNQSDLAFKRDPVSEITLLNGTIAGHAHLSTERAAAKLILYQEQEMYVLSMVFAHIQDIAAFEPLALRIINSLVLTPAQVPEQIMLDEMAETRHIIIDTDMASEDYVSVLYLLNHPGIHVLAITIAGTGEAHCEGGIRSALGLLELSGNAGIPVACGSEMPLIGNHQFPEPLRVAADRAFWLDLPEVTQQADPRPAPQLIVDLVSGSDAPVSIITAGPLTNVAQALQLDAQVMSGVESIWIRGGAIHTSGNVMLDEGETSPVAEWNIYIDPAAANVVLQSGIPVYLIPLDATAYVPVTMSFVRYVQQNGSSTEMALLNELLKVLRPLLTNSNYQFRDALTAVSFSDAQIIEFEEMNIRVIEEGSHIGRTMVTTGGYPVQVAVWANRAYFEELLIAVLNR
jgi:inosine-uridine nucleoside N-ribohydrolase